MESYYADEVTRISERLTNLCVLFNVITKKNEVISLLDRLNKLGDKVMKDLDKELSDTESLNYEQIKSTRNERIKKLMGYEYLIGKIRILQDSLNSILEKIDDANLQINETQQEVIEKSKRSENLTLVS